MGHGVCVNLQTNIRRSGILAYIQPVCVLVQSNTISFWQDCETIKKKFRTPKQPEYSLEEKGTCSGPGGKTEKRIWRESLRSLLEHKTWAETDDMYVTVSCLKF